MGDAAPDIAGRYRLWDGVSLRSGVLVSRRPLAVTTLNDGAVDIVSALETATFKTPAAIAAATGYDPPAVARILDGLHQRGFLEWAPARDTEHQPPVSVVVTVRNDRASLEACLDALAALAYDEASHQLVT